MPFAALSSLTIRRAAVADAARLAVLARDTFVDTFGADNTPEDMALYTGASFGEEIQRAELQDAQNVVLLADRDGELVGYAMLRDGPAPDSVRAERSIEIDRLYVAATQLGAGVGAALMRRCLEEAARLDKDVVWLNVWERNLRAIAFYERWGFVTVGTMPYVLGNDHQTDYVMVRPVAGGNP